MKATPSLTIPLAIAAGGIIVAGAVYLTLRTEEPSTAGQNGDPSLVAPVSPADHILGSPTASVTIVEYADFDCEFCKQFDATLHEVITAEGAEGKVAWVYRNFPIPQLHPNAYRAAEAAECVALTAGNEVYWKFADSLFANQPTNPLKYLALATSAGASASAVSNCLQNASTTVDARIAADTKNAGVIGALGSPYSLIVVAGKAPVVVDGAWPYEALKQKLDTLTQ